MTQLLTKLFVATLIVGVFVVSVKPALALFEQNEESKERSFCAAGLNELVNFQTRKAEIDSKIASARLRQSKQLEQARTEKDNALEKVRTEKSDSVTESTRKIAARAQTNEQKDAVTKFLSTVESARKTRQAAVDAAMAEFRKGVDSRVTTRQVSIDSALKKFKEQTATAVSTAKTECSSSVSPTKVREKLRTSLEAARKQLTQSLSSANTNLQKVDSLAKIRNEKIRLAFSAYKTTVEKAKTELQTAFGISNPK